MTYPDKLALITRNKTVYRNNKMTGEAAKAIMEQEVTHNVSCTTNDVKENSLKMEMEGKFGENYMQKRIHIQMYMNTFYIILR